MKKIMLFFVACISCITVACDSDDDGTKGDDNKFPAPEVTFSAITGVSFTAGWNALETADSYRYEVSYEKDGQVVAVAAQNTETTTFSLDGLLPATDYSVRVVAKAGGKTISDWFSGTVRTLGGESVTFTVTPYERYIENAFIYPYAEVKPSDSEVYYWVSAIPSNSERDPKEWMQEDIDYYMELGKTWDDLVADKLILKGDAESVPFAFTGYDHYYFIVAPVGKNLSEIVVSGEVSRSYRFWYEAREVQMLHESTYEQFAGEWLLQTSGTVKEENGSLDVQEVGEEFPVILEREELERQEKELMLKLEKLPKQEIAAIKAVILENKKCVEAALELGMSVNTLKTHLARALKKLRKDYHLSFLFYSF